MVSSTTILFNFFTAFTFTEAGLSAKTAQNLHPVKISHYTVYLSDMEFDGFSVLLLRTRQTFDDGPGWAVLQGVMQVHQFLSVRHVGVVMYGNRELLPEGLPVQDIAVKYWDVDLG